MTKLILIMALITAPFFSLATPPVSIFDLVNGYSPKTESIKVVTADNFGNIFVGETLETPEYYCQQALDRKVTNYESLSHVSDFDDSNGGLTFRCWYYGPNDSGPYPQNRGVSYSPDSVSTCPPDEHETYTYPHDSDGDGVPNRCYDPADLNLLDSCNAQSANTLLMGAVTSESVCVTEADGSVCKYDAVDIGGGQKAYQMDLEGDCYSDPQPDAVNENENAPLPNPDWSMGDYRCISDGGLLTCSETPEEANNQDGCGTVTGQYVCVSGDTDNDGIPDYVDPDIDGDGVKNEDDLDANGDGKDDSSWSGDKNNTYGSGSGSGSGNGNVEVDLKPVVDAINKLNDSVSKTNVTAKKEPNKTLKSFWDTEYENGIQGVWDEKSNEFKNTAAFTFLEQFRPNLSGGAEPDLQMCFDLGFVNFGCQSFTVDSRIFPAIKIFILISAAFLCRRLIFGG